MSGAFMHLSHIRQISRLGDKTEPAIATGSSEMDDSGEHDQIHPPEMSLPI